MREEGETTSSQEPMMVDEAQVRVATVGGSARRNTFLHPRRLQLQLFLKLVSARALRAKNKKNTEIHDLGPRHT